MQPVQIIKEQSDVIPTNHTPIQPGNKERTIEPTNTLAFAGRKISIAVPESPKIAAPLTPMGSPISVTLDLSNPHLDAATLRKQIALINGSPAVQELILSGYEIEKNTFTELVNSVEKHPKIKKLVLTKRLITAEQITQLQLLVSGKKTLKVVDSEGGKFGPAYMDWHEYNEATRHNHVQVGWREATEQALKCIDADSHTLPESVFNLGSGPGQDAVLLAQAGCLKVMACDADEEAVDILKQNLNEAERSSTTKGLASRVTCVLSPFKDVEVSHESVDLFVASFTWPYQKPSDFPACWEKTVALVKVGGYIAGHFFGPISKKEEQDVGMTFHTESELKELLLKNFEIKWFKKEPEGTDFKIYGGSGAPWGDLFSVVAKKIKSSSFPSDSGSSQAAHSSKTAEPSKEAVSI